MMSYHVRLITRHKILFVVGTRSRAPHQRTKVLTTNVSDIMGDLPDTISFVIF
jgi:hypothetical protein